jgi:chromosome segregation ATPase
MSRVDWPSVGDAAARIITAGGAVFAGVFTARNAARQKRTAARARTETTRAAAEEQTTRDRLAREDKAYDRSISYLESVLRDCRSELDDCRREAREAADEARTLLAAERAQWAQDRSDLEDEVTRCRTRIAHVEAAARRIARAAGQGEPDL